MDAEFASTTHSQISQSEAFLSLGLFDKANFTSSYIVPENGILYVQVVTSTSLLFTSEFTNEFTSAVYKCI